MALEIRAMWKRYYGKHAQRISIATRACRDQEADNIQFYKCVQGVMCAGSATTVSYAADFPVATPPAAFGLEQYRVACPWWRAVETDEDGEYDYVGLVIFVVLGIALLVFAKLKLLPLLSAVRRKSRGITSCVGYFDERVASILLSYPTRGLQRGVSPHQPRLYAWFSYVYIALIFQSALYVLTFPASNGFVIFCFGIALLGVLGICCKLFVKMLTTVRARATEPRAQTVPTTGSSWKAWVYITALFWIEFGVGVWLVTIVFLSASRRVSDVEKRALDTKRNAIVTINPTRRSSAVNNTRTRSRFWPVQIAVPTFKNSTLEERVSALERIVGSDDDSDDDSTDDEMSPAPPARTTPARRAAARAVRIAGRGAALFRPGRARARDVALVACFVCLAVATSLEWDDANPTDPRPGLFADWNARGALAVVLFSWPALFVYDTTVNGGPRHLGAEAVLFIQTHAAAVEAVCALLLYATTIPINGASAVMSRLVRGRKTRGRWKTFWTDPEGDGDLFDVYNMRTKNTVFWCVVMTYIIGAAFAATLTAKLSPGTATSAWLDTQDAFKAGCPIRVGEFTAPTPSLSISVSSVLLRTLSSLNADELSACQGSVLSPIVSAMDPDDDCIKYARCLASTDDSDAIKTCGLEHLTCSTEAEACMSEGDGSCPQQFAAWVNGAYTAGIFRDTNRDNIAHGVEGNENVAFQAFLDLIDCPRTLKKTCNTRTVEDIRGSHAAYTTCGAEMAKLTAELVSGHGDLSPNQALRGWCNLGLGDALVDDAAGCIGELACKDIRVDHYRVPLFDELDELAAPDDDTNNNCTFSCDDVRTWESAIVGSVSRKQTYTLVVALCVFLVVNVAGWDIKPRLKPGAKKR